MMRNGLHINANGSKRWFLNDQLHRTDGPAIEYADGDKFWYLNDRLHREDGPAVVWADGSKYWYLNHQLHRTDGPAIERADGIKRWYLNGQKLSFNQWLEANTEISDQQRVMFKLEWT
jgi:endo-1,4-beta-mannosidase